MNNLLTIDDGDFSVSYKKSMVNVDFQHKTMLEDLMAVYNENPEDLFLINDKNAVSLIMENNKEITLFDYKKYLNANDFYRKHYPCFLKLTNDILSNSGNDIIIDCNLCGNQYYENKLKNQMLWFDDKIDNVINGHVYRNYTEEIDFALMDVNGYENCKRILSNNFPDMIPAVLYCSKCIIKQNNIAYQGYMPAIGQMKIILDNMPVISYILKSINEYFPGIPEHAFWWSSSELKNYNDDMAWGISKNSQPITAMEKCFGGNVFPIFKKMKSKK